MMTPTQRLFRRYAPLFAILLLGVVLRVWFQSGVLASQDLDFISSSWDISLKFRSAFDNPAERVIDAFQELRSTIGLVEFARRLPLAGAMILFGPTGAGVLAVPIIGSVVSIVLVYWIAARLAGWRAGLISALVFSAMPADVFSTSTFSSSTLVTLLGCVCLYLWAGRAGNESRSRSAFIGIPAWVGLAALAPPVAVGLLLSLGIMSHLLGKTPRITSVLVLSGAGIVLVRWLAKDSWIESGLELLGQQGLTLLLLTIFLAATQARHGANKRGFALLVGLVPLLLAVFVGSDWENGNSILLSPGLSLALVLPTILGSTYLSRRLPLRLSAPVVSGIVAVTILAAYLAQGPLPIHVARFEQAEWLFSGYFLLVLHLALGVGFIVLLLISIARRQTPASSFLTSTAVGLLVLSFLPAIVKNHELATHEVRPWQEAFRQFQDEINAQGVYVSSGFNARLLSYISGFTITRSSEIGPGTVVQLPENLSTLQSGLALIREDAFFGGIPPESWRRVGQYGAWEAPGVAVYRTGLPSFDCSREIPVLKAEATSRPAYQPLSNPTSCLEIASTQNLLAGSLTAGNLFPRELLVLNFPEDGIARLFHKYFVYPDGRTFDIQVDLEPGRAYLYQVTLLSREPVTALYGRIGDHEFSYGLVRPEEWQTFALLIVTPEDQTAAASFSPLLVNNYSLILIEDYSLVPLEVP